MKSLELLEKVTKAEEKVKKISATIEKKKALAAKKFAEMNKKGYSVDTVREFPESFELVYQYKNAIESVEDNKKKLVEAEKTLANWKEKYNKQKKLETVITRVMPEEFTQLKNDLAAEWTAYDIKRKQIMREKRKSLAHKEFREIYPYTLEMEINISDEAIQKINERDAELYIIDLYNRIKAITGENIESWEGIHWKGNCLNGYVEGKNGIAKVETITAGGYNIQRFHLRVLVKEVK